MNHGAHVRPMLVDPRMEPELRRWLRRSFDHLAFTIDAHQIALRQRVLANPARGDPDRTVADSARSSCHHRRRSTRAPPRRRPTRIKLLARAASRRDSGGTCRLPSSNGPRRSASPSATMRGVIGALADPPRKRVRARSVEITPHIRRPTRDRVPARCSVPMIPERTSPVPPVARPGIAGRVDEDAARSDPRSTVGAPFSRTTTPWRWAKRRAASIGSASTCRMGIPARRAISPGWGVRTGRVASDRPAGSPRRRAR